MRATRTPFLLPVSLAVLPMLLLAGCGGTHTPVTVAATPPPPAPTAPMPAGASEGMLVPSPLADGSFPTPNQQLSEAGAVWHLRAGLNVAALSCPGVEGATIRTGYNAWLKREKAPLGKVATSYAAEYDAKTPTGRAAFDHAMTTLYNFFSQTPVRPAFCTAAAAALGELATQDAAALARTAPVTLASLDQPFLDFYRAYDDWRSKAPVRPVIAAAAVTPPGPAGAARLAASPGGRPALDLDLASLPVDTEVSARR